MEENEIMKKDRKEKVKYASVVVWTLLTICLIYAEFQGMINMLGNVLLLMMYYIGIIANLRNI